MPGAPLPGDVASAETLEGLAMQTGIDAAPLVRTIGRFNRFVRDGIDPDFARGTSAYDHFYGDRSRSGTEVTLGTVEQPPFFAVPIHMGMLGTNGGPRTDGSARILDHASSPIPGLYGAGNVIACPTGGVYAGAGGTLGPAIAFGYIAGRAAARANAG